MEREFEIIFEFRRMGGAVKVSAVDPVSLIEVSLMGPAQASEFEMRRIAARKLRYAIEMKSKKSSAQSAAPTKKGRDRRGKPGLLV